MDLFFQSVGNNEKKILILHGLFGMSDNWMGLANQWSKNYTVICPDLRNHGRSPHSHSFGYYPMLDDIIQLIDNLNIHEVFLLGHSMGGKLAMILALEYPELVSKLCIADISPINYPPTRHSDLLEIMQSVNFDLFQKRSDIETWMNQKIKEDRLKHFILKNIKSNSNGRFSWKLNLQAISENIVDIFEFPNIPNSFSKPTLFLKGEFSDYISSSDLHAVSHYFPLAKSSTVPKAGHWIHADNPSAFSSEVISFFSDQDKV